MSKYIDIRQELWKDEFAKALPYDAYLENSPKIHAVKWRAMAERVRLSDAQKTLAGGFIRKMPVLALSGVWCGDCVRQGPMFHALAEAAGGPIDLRFAERVDGSTLMRELHINGAMKVPVAVFLSEDLYELGRFGDRLLTVYRRMARTQLGAACDTGLVAPPEEELQAELQEWLDIFERMQIILRLSPHLRSRYND